MTQELLLSPHGKERKDDTFKLSHDIHLLNFHHNVDFLKAVIQLERQFC